MRKRGRPRVENPKRHMITLRMDDREYDELKDTASSRGYTITELIKVSLDYYRNNTTADR